MATKLTKKQQGELTEKLTGIIQKNNALQLRLSMDRSVNEMNVSQISGALNRIHGQAIGKELPTEITIPVKQLGSGDPSPDNVRPIVGYQIDGIGTVYGGELNIDTGVLTVTYGFADLGSQTWLYNGTSRVFYSLLTPPPFPVPGDVAANAVCSNYPIVAHFAIANKQASIYYAFQRGINIMDLDYTNTDSFKGAMSNAQLAYQLATPETYTLTPEQMIQLLDQL